ncbi:MAG: CinA family protein [Advenella sp.]
MLPIKFVARYMTDHALTLVTAESCTAGLIASTLSEAPNAGKLLDCAFVTYTVHAKERLLGVKAETIEQFNLTSEQVAAEMAVGALARSSATVAVSDTGVVDNSDPAIKAGTQCFGWAFKIGDDDPPIVFTETKRFTGSSRKIRKRSALYALSRIPAYAQKALKEPD